MGIEIRDKAKWGFFGSGMILIVMWMIVMLLTFILLKIKEIRLRGVIKVSDDFDNVED